MKIIVLERVSGWLDDPGVSFNDDFASLLSPCPFPFGGPRAASGPCWSASGSVPRAHKRRDNWPQLMTAEANTVPES